MLFKRSGLLSKQTLPNGDHSHSLLFALLKQPPPVGVSVTCTVALHQVAEVYLLLSGLGHSSAP